MADENQELQRMAEDLRRSFQALDEATKKANVGLDAFNKELKTVPGQLIKGMGGLASTVAKGNTGLNTMTAVVDVAANAISGLAKTVPIFGEAMSAATKAIAEGAKIVVEQLDQTAKTFNAMSATGALVADGMTGLSRQFTTAGLNLQQFQKVVSQNSIALARFRGMAGDGAEEFSKAVGNLTQKQDTDLRKIGMSAEDIAGTTAAFVTQQTRLGKSQSMTTEQLTAGTKQYALELDQLSKVTGLSREAIQKQQDAALSEGRFRAVTDELIASGNEKQAKALLTLQTRMGSFDGELGQGIRDLASGAVTTEAARKMVVSTGGAAQDIINRVKEGVITQDQAQIELTEAYKNHQIMLRNNAKYLGDSSDSLNKYAAVSDLVAAQQQGVWDKAGLTQKTQIKKTDDLTNSTVDAQQKLEMMNTQFSEMAIKLMPAAADAIKEMTGAMLKMVKWANGQFGGGGGGSSSGSISSNANAAAGGAVGAAASAETGYTPEAGGGPPSVKPEDYISFTGGTGDKAHFDQLEPGVKSQFIQMARDYNQLTGKKLQVNSAFRSPNEQANVNSGANPKAAPGMSKHNFGRAIDIQSDQRSYLEQQGLLSQYGFSPLADDPPHISAANGAILSGPGGGYRPNLTMHGTEAIVPLNSPAAQSMGLGGGETTGLMAAQLEKLEEMVSVMRNQLAVSQKIMQYAS